MSLEFDRRLETLVVHAGVEPESTTGAIMTPIFQTSTYVQPAPGQDLGYDYSRAGNPTRSVLEKSLALLEGADHAIGKTELLQQRQEQHEACKAARIDGVDAAQIACEVGLHARRVIRPLPFRT